MFDYSTDNPESQPAKVSIIGLGGAGNNILDMIEQDAASSYSLYSVNLDLRLLKASKATHKIHLGESLTFGLGSGGDPQVGAKAAKASESSLVPAVKNNGLVILLAGLGGGTGSGAAPVIAKLAGESGSFIVSVVTMPFTFEGARRREQANQAIDQLLAYSDIVLCFENDRMESLLEGEQKALEAFEASNRLLAQAAEAIPTLAIKPGLFHLGLDDLKTIVAKGSCHCLFGVGSASGESRAIDAARQALACPLFTSEQARPNGKEVLIHISGSDSLSIPEIELAVKTIADELPENTQIHFGVSIDAALSDKIKVMTFASEAASSCSTSSKPSPLPIPTAIDETPLPQPPVGPEEVDDTDEEDADEEEEAYAPVSDAQLGSIIRNDNEGSAMTESELDEVEPVDYPPAFEKPATPPARNIAPETISDPEEYDEEPLPSPARSAMGEFNFGFANPEPLDAVTRHSHEQHEAPGRESDYRNRSSQEDDQFSNPSFKGLFSDDNPFIVDGEDLDLPPSMRKKKD